MKCVRHNVWETNSSSSHSISISSGMKLNESITPDENGVILLEGGEYGWEIETYTDPYSKANYCATDQKNHSSRLEMLEKVIKDHTGAKEVIIRLNGDAYIDHQSYGTSDEAFESEETLKQFLFCSASSLHTDNDNH